MHFESSLPTDKRVVLYFDTEQSRYHVQKALNRICTLSGIRNPDNLKVYSLRKHNPAERLEMIEKTIYQTENLGFVVIDGIRDLVTSINDETQATDIASKLLKWSEERSIHIMTVLHQNKGDNNARGHLGSELTNKAQTVLSVTKSDQDKNISIVEAEQCRDKEPEPFAFEIKDELPVIAENWELRTSSHKDKLDFQDIENYKLWPVFSKSFSRSETIGYSELVRLVKLNFQECFSKAIGDNKAKDLITLAKSKGWVLQEEERKPYYLGEYDTN